MTRDEAYDLAYDTLSDYIDDRDGGRIRWTEEVGLKLADALIAAQDAAFEKAAVCAEKSPFGATRGEVACYIRCLKSSGSRFPCPADGLRP